MSPKKSKSPQKKKKTTSSSKAKSPRKTGNKAKTSSSSLSCSIIPALKSPPRQRPPRISTQCALKRREKGVDGKPYVVQADKNHRHYWAPGDWTQKKEKEPDVPSSEEEEEETKPLPKSPAKKKKNQPKANPHYLLVFPIRTKKNGRVFIDTSSPIKVRVDPRFNFAKLKIANQAEQKKVPEQDRFFVKRFEQNGKFAGPWFTSLISSEYDPKELTNDKKWKNQVSEWFDREDFQGVFQTDSANWETVKKDLSRRTWKDKNELKEELRGDDSVSWVTTKTSDKERGVKEVQILVRSDQKRGMPAHHVTVSLNWRVKK